MLVRFTTTKGSSVWVNPAHVRTLRPTRKGTEIVMGSGVAETAIKVDHPAEAVAAMLEGLLPPAMDTAAYLDDDADGDSRQGTDAG